jgi:hypothetical protein
MRFFLDWPLVRDACRPSTPAAGFDSIGCVILNGIGLFRQEQLSSAQENVMNDETLNMSIRKLLKTVGIASQREIEHAVERAIASGEIKGTETFHATMTLEIAGLKLNFVHNGDISLE